jgi:DNA polymerase III alpha subunit (gram-positive type)
MKKLVIDTETTGLKTYEHQVLTVGMVLIDVTPKKLKFIDESHLHVKYDEYNVSKMAMAVNKINLKEHHKIGISSEKACDKMHEFVDKNILYDTPVLGHNIGFDIRFLNAMFDIDKKRYPFCSQKEDTMYIWRKFKKDGLISPFSNAKLGTIANYFDIDYSKAHDAIADCKITAKCFHGMIQMGS